MTYTGPFDFLDSQASLDLIFGPNPTMFRLAPSNVLVRILSTLRLNCLNSVTSVRYIFFAIPFNFNMLERSRMIRRKCLPIFF